MKKSILLFGALMISGLCAFAQNTYNIVVFSEDGDGFYAFANGVRQNDKPETNVKITGLTASALNLVVEFENKTLPRLKQNVMPEAGYEHTVRIKKNMKKELKLQYFGRVALADAPPSSGATVAYHTAGDQGSGSTATDNTSVSNTNIENGNTTVTTTSVSTQINSNPNNVSVNVNPGAGGVGINVSGINMNGGGMNSTSSTTVTTTTSSSSSSSSASGMSSNPKTQVASTGVSHSGCSVAMNTTDYNKMKQSVESKPFSETQMSTAKVATKNACLSASQIKGICSIFSMDEDKLAYAKYAYNYCTDKSNYYQVSEVFSFSTTTDELNKFLEQN